ncbi:MAG: hypothetical protein LUG85_09430, partial [Clostridiales bacterium]|nr:hypothetical protein [Clostridiales bacterium]
IICVYEYQDNGLTKAGSELFLNNPRGYGLWLKEKSEFMHDSPVKKFKMHYTFVCDLKDRYSDDIIGDCIGISTGKVKMLKRLNKFLRRLKR